MDKMTGENRSSVRDILARVAHYLPTQGPLDVFVHHNTLHAFEDRHFFDGVEEAARIYQARAYQSEFTFQRAFLSGRINDFDLREAISSELNSHQSGKENSGLDEILVEDIRAFLLSSPVHTTRESITWSLLEEGGLDHHPSELAYPRWEG